MPTFSTYISTYNGMFYQSTLEQTIRQALLYSDEVVVVGSEHSTDGSNDLLDDMKAQDSRVKIYLFSEKPCQETLAEKKTFALRKCTMDYCILHDDDELIHEKYIDTIHRLPVVFPETIAFRFNVIHFYRSFTHYQNGPDWYSCKIYMVKNLKEITHGKVNLDRDNHLINGAPLDSLPDPQVVNAPVTVFHYGWARHDAIIQMKKHFQETQWWGSGYWKDHEFPIKLEDPAGMPEFTGTHPRYMIPVIESEKMNTRHIKEFSSSNNQPYISPIYRGYMGIDMKKWYHYL